MFLLQGMVMILTIDWERYGLIHLSETYSCRKAQKNVFL